MNEHLGIGMDSIKNKLKKGIILVKKQADLEIKRKNPNIKQFQKNYKDKVEELIEDKKEWSQMKVKIDKYQAILDQKEENMKKLK